MASGKTYPLINRVDEGAANCFQNNNDSAQQQQLRSQLSKTITTTTTTVSTTTKQRASANQQQEGSWKNPERVMSVARVEDLGRQAALDTTPPLTTSRQQNYSTTKNELDRSRRQISRCSTYPQQEQENRVPTIDDDGSIEGNKRVTTISTIAAQSGQSRIVLAVLKDGTELQLRVQEMRPAIFEVGADYKECLKYLEEHQKLVRNLQKQKQSPIEGWWSKYQKVSTVDELQPMTTERKLVYMCMVENLTGCWKALLRQLDQRSELLKEACDFYESTEQLTQALDRADNHVQVFRQEFLNGPTSIRFNQACNELKSLNESALERYNFARKKQQQFIDLISVVGTGNLGDSRVNHLISEAQDLIKYIGAYIDPLERRRIQLESVINTTKSTSSTDFLTKTTNSRYDSALGGEQNNVISNNSSKTTGILREINNFNDLNLVDNWLNMKVEQLNSSLLSSLGASVSDSRSILNKHEQIALECRAIEEATLTFNGKNIHAIKSLDDKAGGNAALFEKQKQLAQRTREVITILEARIVLLRRTIDFYLRSKDATGDVDRMMRRLQVDNSLQSIQFVANELELKDVSSVVASGATIINELQQLQLAQQHGQRSRIVNLNLVTLGIRAIIDQLNQDLAHLKTVLSQRKLVLLNEDATKMANNFSNKCHQLQFWLNNHVKSFLLANNRVPANGNEARALCDNHEQLRVGVQGKTLEVEALLRSLSTLTENFDAKSSVADEIQRATDELRHDWIESTNCLDKRLDLIRKYLAILDTVGVLNRELESLESFNSGRPTTPERTDEDIRANIDQSYLQLTNQVRNFKLDAQKPTELVYQAQAGGSVSNDLNKQQMVDHANQLLVDFTSRKRAAMEAPKSSRPSKEEPPAHQRPQQVDPPRFTRVLQAERAAEPFSTIELECETDQDCQVDWFMNNFKRIPPNIRHTISSEANHHKLTISNFSPVCCGTYIARASNGSGQAVSQCKVRLLGIKEAQDEPASQANPNASLWGRQQQQQQQETGTTTTTTTTQLQTSQQNFQAPSPAVSTTSSFSQWRPNAFGQTNQNNTTVVTENKTISRLIQGVEQPESPNPAIKITQLASDSDTETATTTTLGNGARFPVTQTTYSGPPTAANQQTPQYSVESPMESSASMSRSVSKSPYEGSPQPPVFVKGLTDTMSRSCSRAGLVCLVMGNPPPTIEWMHNNQTIATTKCPRSGSQGAKGSICKLTIETINPRTQGQYVCRATNRVGQTSTGLTLTK